MEQFYGKYDYSIDAKGRVNIPARYRKELSPESDETFVTCRAPGNCLRAYPRDLWMKYQIELDSLPETAANNYTKRQILSTASASVLDRQGRITLTPAQMSVAGITKDVSVIGLGNYIEIWDTARFGEISGNGVDFDKAFYESFRPDVAKQ